MREIFIGSTYRHFKGKEYQVLDIAENTETGEDMVIYKALYAPYKKYARPISMFSSEVDKEKYPDVTQNYRFALVATYKKGIPYDSN